MAALPKPIRQAFELKDEPKVMSTVDEDGVPNIIYVGCTGVWDDERIIVADNAMSKTRANLLRGTRGGILFRDSEGRAYQLKGVWEYHKEGEAFEQMQRWNPPQYTGVAAVVLRIEEIFSGAEKLV